MTDDGIRRGQGTDDGRQTGGAACQSRGRRCKMVRMFRSSLIVMLVFVVFPLAVCHGEEDSSERTKNIVLTPADQLILYG